jgi:glycosyltransferase involved in cell wall biosynthesis
MSDVLRRLPHDITLLVAHHEEDAAIIAEFGDRVRFVGHSTPQRLALYYSAADLLCFPSLYGGFGLVLIEAMACGCPPVVFDYAAMNELVTDDSGYLVVEPSAEAYSAIVQKALSDRRKKTPAACRRAQIFHLDRQVSAVLNLYEKLLWKLSRSSTPAS